MNPALFDYLLPPDRIAQEPAEPRDAARLLVLQRRGSALAHRRVSDLPDLLAPGDLLLFNDTRVLPARLAGRKPTGGRVEIFLIEKIKECSGEEEWAVLLGASRAPREGADLILPGGFEARVLAGPGEGGEARVRLRGPSSVTRLAEAHGRPPLPPYIRRAADDSRLDADRERYQTIFARETGALAAPTAGLHFTPRLFQALERRGVHTAFLTLHVGLGTFQPVRPGDSGRIVLHEESFHLPAAATEAIGACRARGGRVVAVGTTVARTLESRPAAAPGVPEPGSGRTRLFISPGFEFRFVDALMTNFHLPRSSLLMLAAAFAGREEVLAAYRVAVEQGYRFYSYGDAMLAV